jgi:hypothetical protein
MSELMISCKQATEMMAKKEEGKISFANQIRLWYHLFICTCCKTFKKQDTLIVKHLSQLENNAPETYLSAEEKKSMADKLKNS